MLKNGLLIISIFLSLSSFSTVSFAISKEQEQLMEYETKARRGDVDYQFKLGIVYEMGVNTKKDNEQAIYWYKRAEKGGDFRATYRLGAIEYSQGNYNSGILKIKKAYDNGIKVAIIDLALNQLRIKNKKGAESLFEEAMKMEIPRAYYEYGKYKGEYERNNYLAYVYIRLGTLKGYKVSNSEINKYKNKLSTNQVHSANARVSRLNK